MKKYNSKCQWQEGEVEPSSEYIELRYGDVNKSSYPDWLPVALIGKPKEYIFPVKWLIDQKDLQFEEAIKQVCKDLDFYLVELGKPIPWEYAKYHCTTSANVYSLVHWSYFPEGELSKKQNDISTK